MKAATSATFITLALFADVLYAQGDVRRVAVNGTTIHYVEQGTGTPVVFVHGAISDHRTWLNQREPIASRYRFIALDMRYFGPAPWPDSTIHLSRERDAADLAAFIRELRIA